MLRKLLLMLGLCCTFAFSAHAQDKAELFGGYSYLHVTNSPSFSQNGWEISGQYKFADWIGAVADFDQHYGSGVTTTTYLFGPQVSWPARVSPFGHLELGGAHASSGPFHTSSFSLALGGGIDTKLIPYLSWRIFQADYLMTQFGGGTQNNFRFSTGVVIHF